MEQLVVGAVGFLFGGTSVALFNYVKFNGRLIDLSAQFKAHVEYESEWRERVDKKLDKISDQIKANGNHV